MLLGLSDGYVKWFRGYLTKKQSPVLFPGAVPSPFEVLSGAPEGSVLGPLCYITFLFPLALQPLWTLAAFLVS
jgi:hypothetical protein